MNDDRLGNIERPDPDCVCCEGVGYVDHGPATTACPCVELMQAETALLAARDKLWGAVEENERLRRALRVLEDGWKTFYDLNVGSWGATHDERLTLANYVRDQLGGQS